MPPYKKQHFLPAAYLKYFSDDQTICNRKSWVYRFDGDIERRVPVDSQCFEDYFYSKEKAAEIEQYFNHSETIYCDFVDKVRAGIEPSRKHFGDLFLFMVDLSLRNAIHKNSIGQEELEAYQVRINFFYQVILLGRAPKDVSIAKIRDHIASHWRLEIFSAPRDFKFATSDNPSLFATCRQSINGRSQLQLILVPLDPSNLAVAFDKRFLSIPLAPLTGLDVQRINASQIINAESCIYGCQALSDNDKENVRNAFLTRPEAVSEVTPLGWRSYMNYIPPSFLSFVTINPPLF